MGYATRLIEDMSGTQHQQVVEKVRLHVLRSAPTRPSWPQVQETEGFFPAGPESQIASPSSLRMTEVM